MIFGEVVHHVTQPAGWPEPVRSIASLLSSFHCPNKPSNENFSSASSSIISEPLASNEMPAPELYTAKDFQILIHSTAAGLSALAELPHYGSKRSTVPLWSQLLHALADTLSPDVVILEDAPFIMPRAQNVSCQPENLIDGYATLLVGHAIFAASRTHSDRARTNTRNKEDQDESMCSADQDEPISSADQDELICFADEDESICSADSDPCDGSVDSLDSLDLPLQALMLPGRGRRLSAVVPVLLVADPHNIIPLLCSALYQRHVWGIRQPVVGLCCSSTGTIATAIFGWLEPDQSEEGRMPTAHLALAADFRSDPLMGVFDLTDTSSAISLAQFVLGLRTHFEDIKGATSIEAVDSLTPFHWRSDVPDFETQFWGQSDERVASWTHQVHMQMSSSEVSSSSSSSSSSTPRTPSPLLYTACIHKTMRTKAKNPTISVNNKKVDEDNIGQEDFSTTKSKGRNSAYSASTFAALSDKGISDRVSMTNYLFQRHAYTIARVKISKQRANAAKINAMVDLYDRMTAFSLSPSIGKTLSEATVDDSLTQFKTELCKTINGLNCQSSESDAPEFEDDIKFISDRLSALLHAVNGACSCDDNAKGRGANEADRRHQWDALLLRFFQPFEKKRDVLLERKLNLARNLAADDDSSFATEAVEAAEEYQALCTAQANSVSRSATTSEYDQDRLLQARAARDRATRLSDAMTDHPVGDLADKIKTHSSKDPVTGICDAVLTIPFSDYATAMLQAILSSSGEQAKPLKSFMLVQNPNSEEHDAPQNDQDIITNRKAKSNASLDVTSADEKMELAKVESLLRDLFLQCDPDNKPATIWQENDAVPSRNTSNNELLLPVLLAEYKKKGKMAISTAVNQMRMYQVSAVTFLSMLGITDQPVFGLVVEGALGAITMAWKTNSQIYVMERNVRRYDIRDPIQALQFVSILPRLARHGKDLSGLLDQQLANSSSNVKEWTKLHQRPADEAWLEAQKQQAQKQQAQKQQAKAKEAAQEAAKSGTGKE